MIKKTITYADYNGTERTEDFYFNITTAEAMEMELSEAGGLSAMIQNVINAKDEQSIFKIFKDLIAKAYGEKSADGKRFMKVNDAGAPLFIAFSETEAYSKLFMELATNTDEATAFIAGIIPAAAENTKAITVTANNTN